MLLLNNVDFKLNLNIYIFDAVFYFFIFYFVFMLPIIFILICFRNILNDNLLKIMITFVQLVFQCKSINKGFQTSPIKCYY